MKKFLSIALLFSSLANATGIMDWVAPVAVPAACYAVSKMMPESDKKSSVEDGSGVKRSGSKCEMNLSKVCEAATECSACELSKRVVNTGLEMGYKVDNDWKSMLVDSGLNTGVKVSSMMFGDKMNAYMNIVARNPVFRTVAVFACKNIVSSMMKSVPAPAAK